MIMLLSPSLTEAKWCIYVSRPRPLDNGLSPIQHQAIVWTNAALMSIGHWGTKFSEISMKIHYFH